MREFPLQCLSPSSEMVHGLCFHIFFKRNFISLSSIRSYLFLDTYHDKQSQEKKKYLGETELGMYQLNDNEKNNIVSIF